MKSITRTHTPLIRNLIIGSLLLVSFLVTTVLVRAVSADSNQVPAPNGRLVTIYDRGTQKVIVSKADTIGEALSSAGIVLDKKDAVEPDLSQKMVATDYTVNIYRARPVIVVDGATRQKVTTPYQTPAQIAKDAGITMYDEDKATIDRSDNIVAEGAGLSMTIQRATPFTLVLYGKRIEARTQDKTVADMLASKKITLGEGDTLSVDKSTPITAGMTVELWRNGVQTVTEDQPVAFDTEKIQDADQPVGYRQVQTPGVPGAKTVTYEVNMKNGQEVSRTEIQSVVTKEPKKQVEVVGTKPVMTPYTGGGNKNEWLAAAGIPREFWGAADAIVSQESGWNPNAINRSSGACGLAQALPCSKVPGNPYNPVDSLRWMNGYVNGRYGGWEQALAFKKRTGWY